MRKQTKKLSALFLSAAAVVALSAYVLPAPAVFAAQDDHKHKEGEKHDDTKGDEHAGPKVDLGTTKIGGFDVQVTLATALKEGEEAVFIIKPTGGTGEPKSVRAWVGVESGQGSIKTKAEEEKEGEWHAHHKVSKPMPTNSKVWVELETAGGKQRASFDMKK